MMKFFSIILFIFIFECFIVEFKKQKEIRLKDFNYFSLKSSYVQVLKSSFIVFFFFLFYIGFLRVLRIFQDSKYIDLNLIYKNNGIVSILFFSVMLFFSFLIVRNIVLFFFKFHFLRIHYYFQSRSTFYCNCFEKVSAWQYIFWYWVVSGRNMYSHKRQILDTIYYFFKYIGYVVVVVCFLIDMTINNHILIYFSKVLPFFSLYQTIYIINNFFSRKIKLKYESNTYCSIYIDYLHRQRLLSEFVKSEDKHKISFEVYLNISENILGEKPPVIDNNMFNILNIYVISLLF